jgi:hypothetical protein
MCSSLSLFYYLVFSSVKILFFILVDLLLYFILICIYLLIIRLLSTLILVNDIHCKYGKSHICKLLPLFLIIIAELIQINLEFYEKYSLPCLINGVLLYGLISSKFIMMNMSKSEFNYKDLDVLYYLVCVLFSFYFEDFVYVGFIYLFFFIFLKLKYLQFVISVTFQIIQHFKHFGN